MTLSVIGLVVALLSYGVTVRSDTMWLVALGNDIASQWAIPVGAPFRDANTTHWVSVRVLGELVMAGANALERIC